MSRITRSPEARQDLKNIARFIARESQSFDVALRFLHRIEQRVALYATQPEMGKPRPELRPNLHSFAVNDFLVFYRPTAMGIELVRIIRGTRDLTRQF